jgi:uncharacterized protein (DUF305 family)
MQKTNILYGVIGLLVGLLIGGSIGFVRNNDRYSREDVHQMSNGTVMKNSSMNMDMDSMMKGMMSGLEGKTGEAFDKEFLAEMIIHHQGAVEMAQAVIAKSQRPELLKLATDIISAQTEEITMMQEWQKSWFK